MSSILELTMVQPHYHGHWIELLSLIPLRLHPVWKISVAPRIRNLYRACPQGNNVLKMEETKLLDIFRDPVTAPTHVFGKEPE